CFRLECGEADGVEFALPFSGILANRVSGHVVPLVQQPRLMALVFAQPYCLQALIEPTKNIRRQTEYLVASLWSRRPLCLFPLLTILALLGNGLAVLIFLASRHSN